MSGVCLSIFFHFNNSNLDDVGPVQVMLFMTCHAKKQMLRHTIHSYTSADRYKSRTIAPKTIYTKFTQQTECRAFCTVYSEVIVNGHAFLSYVWRAINHNPQIVTRRCINHFVCQIYHVYSNKMQLANNKLTFITWSQNERMKSTYKYTNTHRDRERARDCKRKRKNTQKHSNASPKLIDTLFSTVVIKKAHPHQTKGY